MISAPACTDVTEYDRAAERVLLTESSENESGVAFKVAITLTFVSQLFEQYMLQYLPIDGTGLGENEDEGEEWKMGLINSPL